MKRLLFAACMAVLSVTAFSQADTLLREYTGRYVFPDGNVVPDVTVTIEGDILTMSSSAGTSELSQLGVDSFSVVSFTGTAVFKRNGSNKVNGVHIEAGGYIMDGTREEGTGWSFSKVQGTRYKTQASSGAQGGKLETNSLIPWPLTIRQ